MGKIILDENTDFLDILRYLNNDNLDENKELLNALFEMLYGPLYSVF